jgi:hypothetical protein
LAKHGNVIFRDKSGKIRFHINVFPDSGGWPNPSRSMDNRSWISVKVQVCPSHFHVGSSAASKSVQDKVSEAVDEFVDTCALKSLKSLKLRTDREQPVITSSRLHRVDRHEAGALASNQV